MNLSFSPRTCSGLTGEELLRLKVLPSDPAWEMHKRIARELQVILQSLRVVLPDGQLLAEFCRTHPQATIATIEELVPREGHKRRRLN
jgi:hypothetical protein